MSIKLTVAALVAGVALGQSVGFDRIAMSQQSAAMEVRAQHRDVAAIQPQPTAKAKQTPGNVVRGKWWKRIGRREAKHGRN